jgi:uncharacterized protein YuzE
MKISYDPSTDAAYVYLVSTIEPGGVSTTYCCDPLKINGQIHLDFDASGRLVGIEVLGASRKLPADLLKQAEPMIHSGPVSRP